MKKIGKIVSLLLALMICLVLTIPAFAAGETIEQEGELTGGKITINEAVPEQKYDLYQILYLESYNVNDPATGAGQYAYKATAAWLTFLQTPEAQQYVILDNGYAKWNDGNTSTRAQQFARLALKYAKAHSIKPVATQTPTGTNTTVIFDNLKLGYYLADTTVGTMCVLNTTNPEFSVDDKNRKATITKTVQENGGYGAENDVAIGVPYNYNITINAQLGAQNYVVHDVMASGIDFNGITKIVKVDSGVEVPLNAYDPANEAWDYKLVLPAEGETSLADGCSFHIEFSQTFLATILRGSNIDIYYKGELNQNAVIGNAGNINKTWLTYGENGDITTLESQTITKTWEFSVFKFTEGESGARQPLSGATFKLCNDKDPNADGLTFSKAVGAAHENTYTYDPEGTVTEFTSGDDGMIYFQGLDQATYYLYETKAPAGYNKLSTETTVTIGENGTVYQYMTEAPDKQIAVINNAGSLLPSTGGIGTTIFYIVGSVLLVGVGVLLVVRKRMRLEKEFE